MTAEERLAKQRSQGAIPKRRPVKQEDSESTNEQSKYFLTKVWLICEKI